MKKILLVTLLLIPLMLMTNQIAYGGGEPTNPNEKIVGPSIEAVLGLKDRGEGIDLLLSGVCNGTPFTYYDADYLPSFVGTITPEQLVDQRLEIVGICNSSKKSKLICVDVKNFANDGGMVIADVVIMFVVPK